MCGQDYVQGLCGGEVLLVPDVVKGMGLVFEVEDASRAGWMRSCVREVKDGDVALGVRVRRCGRTSSVAGMAFARIGLWQQGRAWIRRLAD